MSRPLNVLVALFSLWNGDGMRDLLSWWGFGAVSLLLLAGGIALLLRERAQTKALLLSWRAVPIALFILFEIWFLVPLPKGPIEDLLGY